MVILPSLCLGLIWSINFLKSLKSSLFLSWLLPYMLLILLTDIMLQMSRFYYSCFHYLQSDMFIPYPFCINYGKMYYFMFFGTTWRAPCCSINQDQCSGKMQLWCNLSITDLARGTKQWVPALLRLLFQAVILLAGALLKVVGGINIREIYFIKDLFEILICLESKGHPWLTASLLRVQYLPSVQEIPWNCFFFNFS